MATRVVVGVPCSALNFNRYAYANNSPFRFYDPSGRCGIAKPDPAGGETPCDAPSSSDSSLPSFGEAMDAIDSAMAPLGPIGMEVSGVERVGVAAAEEVASAAPAAIEGITAGVEAISARAAEIHGALDSIAQSMRTTAVLSTQEGLNIIASGGRDLTGAQRALLGEGELAASLPNAHAEITAMMNAAQTGLTPQMMAVTRSICSVCAQAIEQSGGVLTGPTTVVWDSWNW